MKAVFVIVTDDFRTFLFRENRDFCGEFVFLLQELLLWSNQHQGKLDQNLWLSPLIDPRMVLEQGSLG